MIHEYALTADISAERVLTAAEVTPLVLPWNECLAALGSPLLLLGSSVTEIDQRVRSQFRGAEMCTHLNDVLRSLTGLSTMLAPLAT